MNKLTIYCKTFKTEIALVFVILFLNPIVSSALPEGIIVDCRAPKTSEAQWTQDQFQYLNSSIVFGGENILNFELGTFRYIDSQHGSWLDIHFRALNPSDTRKTINGVSHRYIKGGTDSNNYVTLDITLLNGIKNLPGVVKGYVKGKPYRTNVTCEI